ncbi:hypothetical protein SF123566_4158 [Shigella flexneri 1235-66]|nr:hypothetical protein SF123566_4158 [Shigella flexneri 1235-66]
MLKMGLILTLLNYGEARAIILNAFLSSACAGINKFKRHFQVFFISVIVFRLVILIAVLSFPCVAING